MPPPLLMGVTLSLLQLPLSIVQVFLLMLPQQPSLPVWSLLPVMLVLLHAHRQLVRLRVPEVNAQLWNPQQDGRAHQPGRPEHAHGQAHEGGCCPQPALDLQRYQHPLQVTGCQGAGGVNRHESAMATRLR